MAATTQPSAGLWPAARMKKIADAGLLIAFLDRNDKYHRWADGVFRAESPPFYTADPILKEQKLA